MGNRAMCPSEVVVTADLAAAIVAIDGETWECSVEELIRENQPHAVGAVPNISTNKEPSHRLIYTENWTRPLPARCERAHLLQDHARLGPGNAPRAADPPRPALPRQGHDRSKSVPAQMATALAPPGSGAGKRRTVTPPARR